MEYALSGSQKVVSYFKYFFEFFEYDERDKYRDMYEARYTKDSYYTYIKHMMKMIIYYQKLRTI
jgi:hypothetical protein